MDIILTVNTLILPSVLRGVNLDMALWGGKSGNKSRLSEPCFCVFGSKFVKRNCKEL